MPEIMRSEFARTLVFFIGVFLIIVGASLVGAGNCTAFGLACGTALTLVFAGIVLIAYIMSRG